MAGSRPCATSHVLLPEAAAGRPCLLVDCARFWHGDQVDDRITSFAKLLCSRPYNFKGALISIHKLQGHSTRSDVRHLHPGMLCTQ